MSIQIEKEQKLIYKGKSYTSHLEINNIVRRELCALLSSKFQACDILTLLDTILDSEFREKLVQLLTVEYATEGPVSALISPAKNILDI